MSLSLRRCIRRGPIFFGTSILRLQRSTAEESEMREGTGLMKEGASPCLEFGGGIGTGVARPDRTDSEAEPPLLAIASAL